MVEEPTLVWWRDLPVGWIKHNFSQENIDLYAKKNTGEKEKGLKLV